MQPPHDGTIVSEARVSEIWVQIRICATVFRKNSQEAKLDIFELHFRNENLGFKIRIRIKFGFTVRPVQAIDLDKI